MKQKITFLVLSILLIGLFIFKYDKVIEEQKEDEIETILSLTIDGEKAENFPSKESGKTIERIECEEGYLASTGEMGPFSSVTYGTQARQISSWYYNDTWFVWNASPWFHRGGDFGYGTSAGVFSSFPGDGYLRTWIGYRIVLAF